MPIRSAYGTWQAVGRAVDRLHASPPFPTTLAGALNAAFKEVGFTTEGLELSYSQESDGVEVAERLRPIKRSSPGVEMTFDFTMAQFNPRTSPSRPTPPRRAIVTRPPTEVIFTWPKSGGTQRVSIVWQADDDLERLVLAKCFAGGDISIPRRKGADPAAVGVTFTVEENPAVSTTSYAVRPSVTRTWSPTST